VNAEIIAVGSELLSPQRVDTNSLWLTGQLNVLGVEVVMKTVVGDDRDRLAATIRAAIQRSEIVVLTGGLGPTEDDVTRDAASAALGLPLELRQDVLDRIEERFRRMGRTMAEINRRQAYVLSGAEVLPNPNGTAPGQWVDREGRIIVLLPGPPLELKPMFEASCISRFQQRLPKAFIRTRFYRVAGMTESDLDQLISPVYTRYTNPATTILAAPGDIQVHLRARSNSEEEAERLCEELGSQIERLLGDRIYSRNGDPLEAAVGQLLRERSATVSVAESATGGLVAERLTSVSGSSDYFVGGFLVYNDLMKTKLLGIDSELLARHGAVSEPVAEAMARAAQERTESTYALSVTGEAGPESATGEPVGTMIIGFAGPEKVFARRYRLPGDRTRVRAFAAPAALDLLRHQLISKH
jgi:competence/damage-inducible protein CinA C-terminal domain